MYIFYNASYMNLVLKKTISSSWYFSLSQDYSSFSMYQCRETIYWSCERFEKKSSPSGQVTSPTWQNMHWSIDITSHEIVIFCHDYKGVKNLDSSSWYFGKLYWSKKTFSQWQGVSHLINCPAFSQPLPPPPPPATLWLHDAMLLWKMPSFTFIV